MNSQRFLGFVRLLLWQPVLFLLRALVVAPLFYAPAFLWRKVWQWPWQTSYRRYILLFTPWIFVAAAWFLDPWLTKLRVPTIDLFFAVPAARLIALLQDVSHAVLQRLPELVVGLPETAAGAVADAPVLADVVHLATAVGLCVVVGALLSFLFLGPLHIVLDRTLLKRPLAPLTVAGRKLRAAASETPTRYRRKADRRGAWLVGTSRTGRGAILLGSERVQHTWVVGGTGSGKTASAVLPALRSDILAGRPVVFIDGKDDQGTAAQLYSYARQAGRISDFRYMSLSDPAHSHTYSPVIYGTATEIKDKLIAACEWSEPFYKKRSEEILLVLLNAFESTGDPYCLEDIHAVFSDIRALRALAAQVKSPTARRDLQRIGEDWAEVQKHTTGFRADIGLLTSSEFGGLFRTYRPSIDFWRAYRKGRILYVGLPTMKYQETAVRLARIMLGDLKTVAARIQTELPNHQRRFMCVAIDEFASFVFEGFAEFINKARSAQIGLLLSHQSLCGDLKKVSDHFFNQIVANTNIKICLRQDDPGDAEYFAKLSGTHRVVKRTEQVEQDLIGAHHTGMGSDREVEEFNVSPNFIKALPRGHAAMICSDPRWVDAVKLDYPKPERHEPLKLKRVQHFEQAPPGGVCLWEKVAAKEAKNRPAAQGRPHRSHAGSRPPNKRSPSTSLKKTSLSASAKRGSKEAQTQSLAKLFRGEDSRS